MCLLKKAQGPIVHTNRAHPLSHIHFEKVEGFKFVVSRQVLFKLRPSPKFVVKTAEQIVTYQIQILQASHVINNFKLLTI